ncbi:MAG: hypothetical protein AAGA48_37610 [Myxococcota bacterium]
MSYRSLFVPLLAALVACSDPEAGSAGPSSSTPTALGPTTSPTNPDNPVLTTVDERLEHIGVARAGLDDPDLGGSALRDFTGDVLPPDAHPLRDSLTELAGSREFYVLGSGTGGGVVVDFGREGVPGLDDHVIVRPGGGHEVMQQPVALAARLDDDGRDEIVVVDVRPPSGGGPDQVFVQVIEDEDQAFAADSLVGIAVGDWAGPIENLVAVARDLDGDDIDEIFLAGTVGFDIQMRMYDPATGTLTPFQILSPLPTVTEPIYGLDVAVGEFDGQPGEEVAVAVNHRETTGQTGVTRVFTLEWDPATRFNLASLFDRVVRMEDGSPIVAGGVALADVDADQVDELVVGGTSDRTPTSTFDTRIVVFDLEFGPVWMWEDEATFSASGNESTVRIRQSDLHVGQTSISSDTPTVDNPDALPLFDPAEDVLVNNVLFEFSPQRIGKGAEAVWPNGVSDAERMTAMAKLPREMIGLGSENEIVVDRDTMQFALTPVDDSAIPHFAVITEGFDLIDGLEPHTLRTRPLVGTTSYQTVLSPDGPFAMQLVATNVDNDSIVVRHLPDEHALAFSEPLLMAAVAAPPCYAGPLGQFLNNCGLYYGNTAGGFESVAGSLGHSVRVVAGFAFEDRTFTQSEVRATTQVEVATAFTTDNLQELSISTAYNNGSGEDYVLVSVLALEQFVYEIVSAPPAPDGASRIGERLDILVPRNEAQRMVFMPYDRARPALRPDQVAELDQIFVHTGTEPSTYLRKSDIADYMAGLGITQPGCTELPSFPLEDCGYFTVPTATFAPLANAPVKGSGPSLPSEVEIGFTKTTTESWQLESTLDVELSTGGVVFGMSIGQTQQSDVSFGQTSSVSYGMELGAIDDSIYTPYGAGVLGFTHTFACEGDECQSFEVVTGWVTGDW